MLLVAPLLVVALVLGGCSAELVSTHTPEDPATEQEALDLLDEAVQRAEANDLAGLCGMGTGNCEGVLEAAGTLVPTDRPTIVINELMTDVKGDGEAEDARLLVVCGARGDGSTYVTEMAIIPGPDGFIVSEPVYWSGLQVSTGGAGSGNEAPTPSIPPVCR